MHTVKRWTKSDSQPYILITEDGERIDLRKTAKERGGSFAAREASRSKMRNVLTEYAGKWYHSMAEASYAGTLDQMIRGGLVRSWDRQRKFSLDVNGIHISNYFADFVVTMRDGSEQVHEVKGLMTPIARMKLLLFEALYPEIALKIIQV